MSRMRFITLILSCMYISNIYTQQPSASTSAVEGDQQEAAKALLPLHLARAAIKGNIAPFAVYLKQGGNLDACVSHGSWGHTPLCQAIEKQHRHFAEWLIANGACVNQPYKDIHTHCSPLHLAIARGNLEIMHALLKKGANVNHALTLYPFSHETPLYWAAISVKPNSTTITQILLENGANPHIATENGDTPLSGAIGFLSYRQSDELPGIVEKIKLLVRYRGSTQGCKECLDKAQSRIEKGLKKYKELSEQDIRGSYASALIHLKRKLRKEKISEENVQLKINEFSSKQLTAIKEVREFIAAFPEEYAKAVTEPLLHCLDIDAASDTAIKIDLAHVALGYLGYPEDLISLTNDIVQAKPDFTLKDTTPKATQEPDALGYTPLLLAAYVGNVQAFEELLKHGASLNEQTKSGYTARMLAEHRYAQTQEPAHQKIMELAEAAGK